MNHVHSIHGIHSIERMYDHFPSGYDPVTEGNVFCIMQWGQRLTLPQHADEVLEQIDVNRLNSPLLIGLVRGLVHHHIWLAEWPEFIGNVREVILDRDNDRHIQSLALYLCLADYPH